MQSLEKLPISEMDVGGVPPAPSSPLTLHSLP
jgi:hypothetical protein